MGQAKQRGTYAQRVAMAEARNEQLRTEIAKSDNQSLKRALLTMGAHRLSHRLVAAGLLARPSVVTHFPRPVGESNNEQHRGDGTTPSADQQ